MRCRRCNSPRLLKLDKKQPQDNDIFRCQPCGFLFSPCDATPPDQKEQNLKPELSTELSRTVAVSSGYGAQAGYQAQE